MEIQEGISRLAIDVGNVISITDTDTVDKFSLLALQAESTRSLAGVTLDNSAPTLECAEAVRQLVDRFGADDTFILSKCKRDTQIKTVEFLKQPISACGGRSFLEHTGLRQKNVLFCTQRSGGSADPVDMEDLLETNGPRTATQAVGKGTVAKIFGITHMIDDRDECLMSVFLESAFLGDQNIKRASIQFGKDGSMPRTNQVLEFVDENLSSVPEETRQKLADDCQANWTVAKGWTDVLEAFGIQTRRLNPKVPLGWDNLSDDQKRVYHSLVETINQPIEMVDAKYNAIPDSFDGRVFGTDAARELSDDYKSGWEGALLYSQVTSSPASTYAQDRFKREITKIRPNQKHPKVLVMTAGGPASGKTSVIRSGLVDGSIDLVMDQNLGKFNRAVEQIELALAHDWHVRIVYVFKPFEMVATKVIDRANKHGRWAPVSGHGRAHLAAQSSVVALYDRYVSSPHVELKLMENLHSRDNPVDPAEISIDDIRPGGKYYLGDKVEWMDEIIATAIKQAKDSGKIEPRLMNALEFGTNPATSICS